MSKEETVKEAKSAFTLPNETVIIKFVPRKKGMAAHVADNHVISGGMLTNAVKTYQCPLSRSGSIANILSKAEKEYLEEELGIKLSVYGDFWTTFKVQLHKDNASNVFNLNNPMEFISVRILEQYTDEIAHSWKERDDKSSYTFAITRPGEEINESKVKLDVKKLAFKLFGKIEDDREKLLGILKLITNQPVSENSKMDWLQGKVQEEVDTNPTNFISIVNDPSFETQILIKKAVEKGIILKKGNTHTTIDGVGLCNTGETSSFSNAVRFLDDEKNQEIRLMIEARLNKTK